MRWLDSLDALPSGPWDGEPVVWISQGQTRIRGDLVRKLVGRAGGIAQKHLQMEWEAGGRPHIFGPQPLWVSSANRGNWNAVAVSRRPVGVDIEVRPCVVPPPINLLHPQERLFLEALSDGARDLTFLRFWTAREAWLKSMGRGLDAPLSCSRAETGEGDIIKIRAKLQQPGFARTKVTRGYVAAVSIADVRM